MLSNFGFNFICPPTQHEKQACPFDAAFWECPPLLPRHILPINEGDNDDDDAAGFEFVLVNAPELLASVASGCVCVCVCAYKFMPRHHYHY